MQRLSSSAWLTSGLDHSVVGGRPVHCRLFSSVPDLYPLKVSSIAPPSLPTVTTKMFLDIANCLQGTKSPPAESLRMCVVSTGKRGRSPRVSVTQCALGAGTLVG